VSGVVLDRWTDAGPLQINAAPLNYQKCERCWHYVEDVGSDAAHPSICGRCVSNLFGEGEKRSHA
jgi:isoleucyl-tRNA synthetase